MRTTKYAVALTEAERARLRTLVGSGTAPARTLTRARILLKANQGEGGPGWSDAAIAGALEVHPATVARVRRQCVEAGVEAALERKRPDRVYARVLDGTAEAHLVALACSEPPAERLESHEQVGGAVAHIFAVGAFGLPRPVVPCRARRQRGAHLADQLFAALVQADHWPLRVMRSVIDLQHVFPVAHERGRVLGRDAPHPPQVRLERILF